MFALRTRFKKDIVAEFVPPKRRSNRAVVLCGGLPGYPSRSDLLFTLARRGYWAFLPRYRGSWESGGRLFAKSPHQDVLDLVGQLPRGFKSLWDGRTYRIRNPKVYLIGSSFGGPAVLLASKHPAIRKVVALAPVTDWRAESRTEPIDQLKKFVAAAFGDGYRVAPNGWAKIQSGKFYNPATDLKKIDGRKALIVHAQDDKVVSFAAAQKFAATAGCQFRPLRRGGHLGLGFLAEPKNWRVIKKFFR